MNHEVGRLGHGGSMRERGEPASATPSRGVVVAAASLLLAGIAIRIPDIFGPALEFHPFRQLLSAVKARGMYYSCCVPDAPAAARDFAVSQWQQVERLEPPVLEWLVSTTYRVTGENLTVALWFSTLFWVSGAVAVFLAAHRVSASGVASILSTAIYLFLPTPWWRAAASNRIR